MASSRQMMVTAAPSTTTTAVGAPRYKPTAAIAEVDRLLAPTIGVGCHVVHRDGFTFDVKAFSLFTGHPTPVSMLPRDLRPEGGRGRVTRSHQRGGRCGEKDQAGGGAASVHRSIPRR